ncbi:MAG TPA: hypothetical protein VKT73_04520 [Xanthobacteraceae bacterium]|nr:hypothetical protein [Xanthobacteraceae bacterium]
MGRDHRIVCVWRHLIAYAAGSVIVAMLSAWTSAAKAELFLQPTLTKACQPAAPSAIYIHRWNAPGTCTNDCFHWRLTCANGRVQEWSSAVNPWITDFEYKLYRDRPWSFFILFPVFGYFMLAALGGMRSVSLVVDIGYLIYISIAVLFLTESVTANPWRTSLDIETALFLNPYLQGALLCAFVICNTPAVARGFTDLFLEEPGADVISVPAQTVVPLPPPTRHDPWVEDVAQFVEADHDPDYYQRLTQQALELKGQLEADAANTRAFFKRERGRRKLTDER